MCARRARRSSRVTIVLAGVVYRPVDSGADDLRDAEAVVRLFQDEAVGLYHAVGADSHHHADCTAHANILLLLCSVEVEKGEP